MSYDVGCPTASARGAAVRARSSGPRRLLLQWAPVPTCEVALLFARFTDKRSECKGALN